MNVRLHCGTAESKRVRNQLAHASYITEHRTVALYVYLRSRQVPVGDGSKWIVNHSPRSRGNKPRLSTCTLNDAVGLARQDVGKGSLMLPPVVQRMRNYHALSSAIEERDRLTRSNLQCKERVFCRCCCNDYA